MQGSSEGLLLLLLFLTWINAILLIIICYEIKKFFAYIKGVNNLVEQEPGYFEEPETKNRFTNLKIFDKFFAKDAAFVDPFAEAWAGEPDPKTRKKTT